jgi:hypothetical protein
MKHTRSITCKPEIAATTTTPFQVKMTLLVNTVDRTISFIYQQQSKL